MTHDATVPVHPYLQSLDSDARHNAERVRALFETLSEEQLTWKPDPKTWSIAECIEHLVMTDQLYFPKIVEALERAAQKQGGGDAPYRSGWFAQKIIHAAGENGKMKVRAFKAFRPDQAGHAGDVSSGQRFLEHQETMYTLIASADGLNLNATKFASPLNSLVRFSIGEGLTVLVSHQKRHLAQAERMMGREGFPKRM